MRINARLDDASQQQIDHLAQATGQSVSQGVGESVARYCAEVTARQRPPMRFLSLAGQGDSGRDDIASNLKKRLSEALAARHGLDGRR